jgi:hypothetical protein
MDDLTPALTPDDAKIVQDAIDALLAVVARSAVDLQTFHDVVAKARMEPVPPFPRVAVATTQSVIDHLSKVEAKLGEVLVALGLPHRAHGASGTG